MSNFGKRVHIVRVQDRAAADSPVVVLRIIAGFKFPRTRYRRRIVVEGLNFGAETASRQAEQTASRADVQKTPTSEVVDIQHLPQRIFRGGDPRIVELGEESRPVLAEGESFSGRNFRRMLGHVLHFKLSTLIAHASPAIRNTSVRLRATLRNRHAMSMRVLLSENPHAHAWRFRSPLAASPDKAKQAPARLK